VEDLLDLELAVRAQVRSASESPADDPRVLAGEDSPRLRSARVDPEELEKRNEEIKTRFVELFGA